MNRLNAKYKNEVVPSLIENLTTNQLWKYQKVEKSLLIWVLVMQHLTLKLRKAEVEELTLISGQNQL